MTAARRLLVVAALAAASPAGAQEPVVLRPHRVESPLDEPDDPPPIRLPPYRVPPPPDAEAKPSLIEILGGLSSLTVGGKPGYSASWYADRPVEGQSADFGLVRQHLEAGVPIYRDGDDLLLATLGVRHAAIDTAAVLPDSGAPFPDELWNVNLGLNYFRRFENGWAGGLLGNFGSASDRPFHSTRELTLSAGGVLRVPASRPADAWLFSLYYSPVGQVNFPVPGAAYDYRASESLRLLIGLPAAVTWKPAEGTTLVVSYLPLLNFTARLTQRLGEQFALSAGYTYFTEGYFLAGRADSRERLLGYEQRLSTGARWEVARFAALEAFAGYAFGRRFGLGRTQPGPLTDRLDIEAGAFAGAAVRIRF